MDEIHLEKCPEPGGADKHPDWEQAYQIVVEPQAGRTQPDLPMLTSESMMSVGGEYYWIDTAAQCEVERSGRFVWLWVYWARKNAAPENYQLIARKGR